MAGKRLAKPQDCPEEVYQVMQQCWNEIPSERPNFSTVYKNIGTCLAKYAKESTQVTYIVNDEPVERFAVSINVEDDYDRNSITYNTVSRNYGNRSNVSLYN